MCRRQRHEKVGVVAEITLEEEKMLRKLTIIAGALALILVTSVPALAQLDMGEEPPEPAFDPDRYTVGCSELYGGGVGTGRMGTDCAVDENGLISLPDGTKAPYTVTGNLVRDQYTGDLGVFVDGEFVVVEKYEDRPPPTPIPEVPNDRAGFLQYDNS